MTSADRFAAQGVCRLFHLDVRELDASHDVLLRPADLRRRARFRRPADRARMTAGRVLAYAVLEDLLELPPGAIDLVPEAGPGKPSAQLRPALARRPVAALPDVSIAHDADVAVLAVSDRGQVGADVERLTDRDLDPGLARLVLHPAERERYAGQAVPIADLLSYWVRKEALVKATGEGLSAGMDRLRVTAPGQAPRLLEWGGHAELAARTELWDVRLDRGYLAVVCLVRAPPPRAPAAASGGRPAADVRSRSCLDVRPGADLVATAVRRYRRSRTVAPSPFPGR